MRIFDAIGNKIGTFVGVGVVPDPGSSRAVFTPSLPATEIADATNYLRMRVEADYGQGYGAVLPPFVDWRGGPGAAQPSVTWQFDPNHPPLLVRGVLENGTAGVGSPANVSYLDLSFTS